MLAFGIMLIAAIILAIFVAALIISLDDEMDDALEDIDPESFYRIPVREL